MLEPVCEQSGNWYSIGYIMKSVKILNLYHIFSDFSYTYKRRTSGREQMSRLENVPHLD